MKTSYSYDNVFLIPQYSDLSSRSEADTSTRFGDWNLKIPLISAPMDTVSGSEMCIALWLYGALGTLHRFMPINENVRQYRNVKKMGANCIVSIGVEEESKQRFSELYEIGARAVCIDIAHGHSKKMKDMIGWVKNNFKETYVVAGNVATKDGVYDLANWGADIVRVGIANGSACETKKVTGHSVPQFSCILECSLAADEMNVKLIADGSIKTSGDALKAFVAGSDYVMVGGLLAGTDEAPGDIIAPGDGFKYKTFRGASSRDVILANRTNKDFIPASEGLSTRVLLKGPVKIVLDEFQKGIQSGMSYMNARKLEEIGSKGLWGVVG